MSDEKTEEATPHKLRKVRQEGQTFKSEDLARCAALAAVVGGMYFGERNATDSFHGVVGTALGFVTREHSDASLLASLSDIFFAACRVVLPLVVAAMLASTLARVMQIGFQVSFKPIEPKFENVNPATGMKRIFSMRSLLTLGLTIIKAAAVGTVMWFAIRQLFPLVSGAVFQPLGALIRVIWDVIVKLILVAVGVYLIVGAVDFLVQRMLFMRQQRMTKDEVKREFKDSEGDPMLKGERKRLAKEMVMTNAPKSLASANMLVVNPTHYAVAVRYRADECPVPVVIAKGVDAQAAILRRLADEAGVPIVANPPVARALYKVPTDAPIPDEMFEVVAAILRWVDGIGAKRQLP